MPAAVLEQMSKDPRKLAELTVFPDGYCINSKTGSYYFTLEQLEDAAEAECARVGIPMICEDRHGIYMSAQPVMIAYTKSKDMMLEEKPSKLTDKTWKVPPIASNIIEADFGGGHATEDSDGEEILDIKKLKPHYILHLVSSETVT